MSQEKPRRINLKRKFVIWCEKTTFHAIPNIVNNEQFSFKLMWSICLIASVCYCCRILASSIIDYYEFNVLTKFEIIQESSSLFPGSSVLITFCNLNKYDLSKDTRLHQTAYTIASSLNTTEGLDPKEELKLIEETFLNETNFTQLNHLHFTIEDMLTSCRYNQMPCNKLDFKQINNELYGNCYVFNSKKQLTTSKYGPKYGLQLELFIGSEETSLPMNYLTGAVVFINNQTSLLSQNEIGIDLAPGSQTNIAINQMLILKLPRPYNDCFENKLNKVSYSRSEYSSIISDLTGSYSQIDCIQICHQYYLLNQFRCLDSSLKYFSYLNRYFNDYKECSNLIKNASVLEAKKALFENELCFRECPSACDSILYRIASLSTSDYPSKFYEKLLKKNKIIQKKFQTRAFYFKKSLLSGNYS